MNFTKQRSLIGIGIFLWAQYSFANDMVNTHCYGYLTELVRSSHFPFRDVAQEKVNLILDSIEDDRISARLGYDNEETGEDINPTSYIGWIVYDRKAQKLFNTSPNLEHPEELKFNTFYATAFEQCDKKR